MFSPSHSGGIISFRSQALFKSSQGVISLSRREGIIIASHPPVQIIVRMEGNLIKQTALTLSPVFSCLVLGSGTSDLILQTIDWCFDYVEKRITPRLPLMTYENSDFISSVLPIIHDIPYGETRTYGDIARTLGFPNKSRAIGQACHKNPFPLLIPCHRVVGKNNLGGFSQDLEIKRKLLKFETLA